MKETEFKIQLHNKLSEVADLLMFYYQPCGLDKDGNCHNGNIKNCCHHTFYEKSEGGCIFNSDNGCTIKNLGCKIWFCNEAYDKLPRKLKKTLRALEIIDRLYALSSYPHEHYIEETDEYRTDIIIPYLNE
jgi:hypothetical protein